MITISTLEISNRVEDPELITIKIEWRFKDYAKIYEGIEILKLYNKYGGDWNDISILINPLSKQLGTIVMDEIKRKLFK